MNQDHNLKQPDDEIFYLDQIEDGATWTFEDEHADADFPVTLPFGSAVPSSTQTLHTATRSWWMPFKPSFAANGACISANLAPHQATETSHG